MHSHIKTGATAAVATLALVLATACERTGTDQSPGSAPSGAAGESSVSQPPRQGMNIPQPSGADDGPSPRPGGGASAAIPAERQPVGGTDEQPLGGGGASSRGGAAGHGGSSQGGTPGSAGAAGAAGRGGSSR